MKSRNHLLWAALACFLFAGVTSAFMFQDDPFDWGAISLALQNLALLVIPALGAMVARWLNTKYQLERAKLSEQQTWMLDTFIRTVVFAAEQMKTFEWADSKLDYATVMVEDWLSRHGLEMDIDEIRARIEAAVKEEFPKLPQPQTKG